MNYCNESLFRLAVTKVYEYKLLSTISALFLHLKRANYVLRMVCSSPQSSCPDLDNFSLFGWQRNGTDIQIEWDSSHPTQHSTTKCTCTTRCSSGRCSCFKNCSACTAKCRCSRCNNPHNDGITVANALLTTLMKAKAKKVETKSPTMNFTTST